METKDWYAWIDFMPPKPDRLQVIGNVLVGNPGVQVRLTEKEPPGFNPAILLLDMYLYQQPGVWPQQTTWVQAEFDKTLTPDHPAYEQIDILFDNQIIAQVPVEAIHLMPEIGLYADIKNKLVSVKNYQVKDGDVTISFSMKDSRELELVYEDKQFGKLPPFTGRAIYREQLQLGFFPTVRLEEVPDSHITTLSLAVPSANRLDNAKSIPIKTFAIRTTHRSTIAGTQGKEGQAQVYETLILEGNAW